jgi:hypothetical protein
MRFPIRLWAFGAQAPALWVHKPDRYRPLIWGGEGLHGAQQPVGETA